MGPTAAARRTQCRRLSPQAAQHSTTHTSWPTAALTFALLRIHMPTAPQTSTTAARPQIQRISLSLRASIHSTLAVSVRIPARTMPIMGAPYLRVSTTGSPQRTSLSTSQERVRFRIHLPTARSRTSTAAAAAEMMILWTRASTQDFRARSVRRAVGEAL